jgi:probable HAF family extracellular repeat protein
MPWGNPSIQPASDNLSGNNAGEAHAVNGLGQIVGSSANGATPEHAWIWIKHGDGTLSHVDLGTFYGGTSRALAINNRGQVVGWTMGVSGNPVAFIWVPGWTTIRELKSCLPESEQSNWSTLTVATGISDDGTVVGYGTINGSAYTSAFAVRPQ